VTDDHYSTVDPIPDRNDGDPSITNSTLTYHPGQQYEQPDDALLGDINELPRVIVTRVVRQDGRVIETVELAARQNGIYETTNNDNYHHQQQQLLTGEYETLRRSLH